MSVWKKFGGFLVLLPLTIALIITIVNIGGNNNGFWILGVIFLVLIAFIMSIPAGLFVWIGVRKDRKKKEKQAAKDEFKFDSFVK